MRLKMVSLTRKSNGAFLARKGIPADVRERYFKLYGVRYEAKFYASSRTPTSEVKQRFAEWCAEADARIGALRQEATGVERTLSHREAHALAGEWYVWFVNLFEEDPGAPDDWSMAQSLLSDASHRFVPAELLPDEVEEFMDEDEETQRHLGTVAWGHGRVSQFLSERKCVLSVASQGKLAAAVFPEYVAAAALLKRRAEGNYAKDERPSRFPSSTKTKQQAGMTCWQLFEAWVGERQPKPSTVDRRRGVFLHLKEHFKERDIAEITELDAVEWKDVLVTPDRAGCTVNDVWLGAARGVFNWALSNKKIKSNPFTGLKVAYAAAPRNRDSRAFTAEEASMILAASSGAHPTRIAPHYCNARRWVPWLCAYTGMRVQEATQLRGSDIVEVDGIMAIRILPGAGTQKNNSARTIPLHEHLIAQGFVTFAAAFGSRPMFYNAAAQATQKQSDPLNPQKPLAIKTREHLAKWVREIGVDDPELQPNHAWRHLFKEIGDHCGIPEKISDAITGHAPKNVARTYGKVRLEVMARELKKFPRFMLIGA